MYILCFSLLILGAYGEHMNKNFTTVTHKTRSGRQYGPPAELFKPSGYHYPSNQKIQQITHDNRLHIYLFQNKLSLYCATDTTYEKITWKKYTCPNQLATQNGETIAVGPMVPNPNLYGINSFGRNEEYVSELLIKQPLTPQTDGIYVCEGTFISDKYPHEPVSTVRDIVIIGGRSMYQNCFSARISTKRSTTNYTLGIHLY